MNLYPFDSRFCLYFITSCICLIKVIMARLIKLALFWVQLPPVEVTPCFLWNAHVQSPNTQIKIPDFCLPHCDLLSFLTFFYFSSAATLVTCALFCCQNKIDTWVFYLVSQVWSSVLFQCPGAEDTASTLLALEMVTQL